MNRGGLGFLAGGPARGERGEPGWPGIPGGKGPPGPPGVAGPQGFIGCPGSTGPIGNPGSMFLTGDMCPPDIKLGRTGDFYMCNSNGNIFQKVKVCPEVGSGCQEIWVFYSSIQGEMGISGPIGPQGLPGVDGTPGATGATGAIGPSGGPGIEGPTGPPGPTGPQGVAGPSGPLGPTGPTGPAPNVFSGIYTPAPDDSVTFNATGVVDYPGFPSYGKHFWKRVQGLVTISGQTTVTLLNQGGATGSGTFDVPLPTDPNAGSPTILTLDDIVGVGTLDLSIVPLTNTSIFVTANVTTLRAQINLTANPSSTFDTMARYTFSYRVT